MATYSANVLLDILFLCFASIGIALPLYYYIRQIHPELAWNYHGNVRTSSFTKLDLLGILLVTLFYCLSLFLADKTADPASPELDKIPNIVKFLSGLIFQAIPVVITFVFLAPRINVLELFGMIRPRISRILLTSIIGLFVIYLLAGMSSVITMPILEKNLGKQELQAPVQMILDAKKNNPTLLIYLAILTVIVAPICEEFAFRGFIYGTLKRFSCRFFAATASALLFAVIHTSLWSIVPLFIVGFILAIIYEISGSLWACILTHALFNGVTTFFLIFVH